MGSIKIKADEIQTTGSLDMRKHGIEGLETDLSLYPVNDDQGASKKYVDSQRDSVIQALSTDIDNGPY